MSEKANYGERLERLKREIENALILLGLKRLPPFTSELIIHVEGDYIDFSYSLDEASCRAIVQSKAFNEPNCYWYIIPSENVVLKFIEIKSGKYGEIEFGDTFGGEWSNPIYYFLPQKTPVYVKIFWETFKKHSKNTFIYISDDLPYYFGIRISAKEKRDSILRRLANWTLREVNASVAKQIEDVIRNKKKSFRKALDEIIALSEIKMQTDFSYCLTCGKQITKSKKFCYYGEYGYNVKRDHCSSKFTYYLKDRLGIQGAEEIRKKREYLYSQLQHFMESSPLAALEELKENNRELYIQRYKERWKREKAKKLADSAG